MKRIVVIMLIGLCGAATTDAATSPDWKRYEIVVQRNMFSPRRQPPKPATAESAESEKTDEPRAAEAHAEPAPQLPGAHYVLVGTSLIGEHHIAFCEDRRDGRLIRLTPGESLDDFSVKQITQDAVVFERELAAVSIAVGYTLSGEVSAPMIAPLASPSGGAAATTPSPAPSDSSGAASAPAASGSGEDDSTLSIIERLRRRREQELQR